ncbi:putative LRR receptor-like serine/threonine-protein kinase [Nymphaea thermarum]|nr:putative LRR receptor-like serine/threonine-protein kinase [Nymphaea thermarum]
MEGIGVDHRKCLVSLSVCERFVSPVCSLCELVKCLRVVLSVRASGLEVLGCGSSLRSIAIPPAQGYLQAVTSPPAPPAFPIQPQKRRELQGPSSAPNEPSSTTVGLLLLSGSIAIPPAQLYLQAVSPPPVPQAFPIQPQHRRELEGSASPLPLPNGGSFGYDLPPPPPNGWSPPTPLLTVHDPPPPPPLLSVHDPKRFSILLGGLPRPTWTFAQAKLRRLEPSCRTTSLYRDQGDGQGTPVGIIVGSVVGAVAVIGLIAAAVVWKYKKKPAKGDVEQPGERDDRETTQQSPKEDHAFLPVKGTAIAYSMEALEAPENVGNGTAVEKPTFEAKESGRQVASRVSTTRTADRTLLVDAAARHFTYDDIWSITGNFGRVIGEGGSSTVYFGQLPEGGQKVAVKKLKESGSQLGNLLAEIKILMRIHHKNLVSFVGLCEEQDEVILVSEYMASGSLSDILKARASELTWKKRLQIALDAAIGLEYLHTGCKPAVIHRDIKPANILLDENLQAKLADFGLSKAGGIDGTECSAYQTKVAGTMGYIDPEYLYTETLTKKNDVYSFGVVLFELITGKPAIMITETNEKCHLTRWVMPMLMRGKIESLLDPLLKGRCNIQSVWEVAAIANTAVQDPAGRPDMPEIVSTLKAALRMETSSVDMSPVSAIIARQSSFDEIPINPVARYLLWPATRKRCVKVAVKKLKESGSQIGNLLREIMILLRIHHKNLVSLVGFCIEQDEIILVSEYMDNGSLYEILKGMNYRQSEDTRANELTWRKRLQIALDAAIGCKPTVIHRDIKPANILLDENLQAKLTDFGLSKAGAVDGTEFSTYQTRLAGTMGYIDPEYLQTETLTKKSDVYSFGVVLFELITGKPAIMITETNEKCNLTRWVMPMLMRGDIESLLDPLLKGRCNIQSVWEVAAIAKAATQDPAGRPDMPEIVSTLKAALRMETSWVDMAFVSETMTSQSSFDEIPHNPVARVISFPSERDLTFSAQTVEDPTVIDCPTVQMNSDFPPFPPVNDPPTGGWSSPPVDVPPFPPTGGWPSRLWMFRLSRLQMFRLPRHLIIGCHLLPLPRQTVLIRLICHASLIRLLPHLRTVQQPPMVEGDGHGGGKMPIATIVGSVVAAVVTSRRLQKDMISNQVIKLEFTI